MESFFFEVGVFFVKVLLIVFSLVGIIILLSSVLAEHKKQTKKKKKLELEDLGELYQSYHLSLKSKILPEKQFKKEINRINKERKKNLASKDKSPKAYVLDFDGDKEAKGVKKLRDEISLLIRVVDPKKDEVVLRLNNRGGAVHNHGLGASQLKRLRDKKIFLTVCVDELAASGGYLMASVANKIIASHFAFIGSIGVIAQIPNLHRYLQKKNVDFEEHTAGKYKTTITLFGEVTEAKREKLKSQLDEIHQQFKDYVCQYRPSLDLEKLSTGEVWLGQKAKDLGLVDHVSTSDDYLMSLLETKTVYLLHLKEEEKKTWKQFLEKQFSSVFNSRWFSLPLLRYFSWFSR